jgi:hypothetical protein
MDELEHFARLALWRQRMRGPSPHTTTRHASLAVVLADLRHADIEQREVISRLLERIRDLEARVERLAAVVLDVPEMGP